jgi:hypothetical protein
MGLSNFAAATVIIVALIGLDDYSNYAWLALLVGYWLMVLMFGAGIKRFLNEPDKSGTQGHQINAVR